MGTWLLLATAACLAWSASSFHAMEGGGPIMEEIENVKHSNVMMCYMFARQLDAKLKQSPIPEFLCLCSRLVILKADLLPNGLVSVEDSMLLRDLMQKLLMIKTRVPHLKIFLCLKGSASYTAVTMSPRTMIQCSRSVAMWLREYGFDGLEIDWQYPGIGPGSSPLDKVNLPLLLRALERELDKMEGETGLILRVGYEPSLLTTSYLPKELSNCVEYIAMDVLDMHDGSLGTTGFNAPLYYSPGDQSRFNNVDAVVQLWKKAGVSPDRLILNIPLFGASYQLADEKNVESGAPAVGPGPPCWRTQEAGVMSFKEICDLVTDRRNEWETFYNQFTMVPFSTDKKTWVSHEDMKSVTSKALYVVSNELGGVGVYTVDSDDDEGTCYQLRYPLLNTILEVMEPERFLGCRNLNLYANVTALNWRQAMSPLGPLGPPQF